MYIYLSYIYRYISTTLSQESCYKLWPGFSTSDAGIVRHAEGRNTSAYGSLIVGKGISDQSCDLNVPLSHPQSVLRELEVLLPIWMPQQESK